MDIIPGLVPDMQASPASRGQFRDGLPPPPSLGFGAVAAARLLTLPRSLWECDEILFVKGVEQFDPLHHQPHPPGYPLLIGLGKLLNLVFHDPFTSLVALSVISSLVGYWALVDAFRRIAGRRPEPARRWRSPARSSSISRRRCSCMGRCALSDPPAADVPRPGSRRRRRGWRRRSGVRRDGPAVALGAFASAAIGCRPQLALAVLPMLAVALWQAPELARRPRTALGRLHRRVAPLVRARWWPRSAGRQASSPSSASRPACVAQYDATRPRAGGRAAWVAVRFLAHPWGTRWTSLPVLALAAAGIVGARRGRRRTAALPLAVLCARRARLRLLVMDPVRRRPLRPPVAAGRRLRRGGGVRGAGAPGAGAGRRLAGRRLLAAGFIVYTWPVLAVRTTTDSPPVQAARWIERSASPEARCSWSNTEMAAPRRLPARGTTCESRPIRGSSTDRQPPDPAGLPARRRREPLAGRGDVPLAGQRPYGKLTRGHYRVVSLSPIPPDRWYAPLRGVYAFEPSLRQPLWRWLGPDAAIRSLGSRKSGRTVALTSGCPNMRRWTSVTVSVAVDGGLPGRSWCRAAGAGRSSCRSPRGTDLAEIAFRLARRRSCRPRPGWGRTAGAWRSSSRTWSAEFASLS